VAADRVERAVETPEGMADADADDGVGCRVGRARPPGRGIRLDPLQPVGNADGSGPGVALGVQGGVDTDRGEVRPGRQRLQQPHPGAAAQVDDVTAG